ncbi:MAG: pentapeptide repeat-containing protein [Fimbriimonadia bacterium]|nr:pentapeptide repeat-containing protein [Fimbriimonadia bacterium]
MSDDVENGNPRKNLPHIRQSRLKSVSSWLKSFCSLANFRSKRISFLSDTFRRAFIVSLTIVIFILWTLYVLGLEKWTTDFAQGFATVIVGYGALETFIWNYRQKQEHFGRQLLDSQFFDIQNRIASEDPKQRANAALRLAEMAQQGSSGEVKDSSKENYPYFKRAINQLSMSLRMDNESQVRIEVIQSLNMLSKFASDSDNRALLLELIKVLAETNRQARTSFAKRLANYCAMIKRPLDLIVSEEKESEESVDWRDDPLSKLHLIISFTERLELEEERVKTNWWCLHQLTNVSEFKVRYLRAENGLLSQDFDEILNDLVEYSERLKQSSLALVEALKLLRLRDVKDGTQIDLSRVFLSGSNLGGICLSDADLSESWLQGANWSDCILRNVTFDRSGLQRAEFIGATFETVTMNECKAHNMMSRGSEWKDVELKNAFLWESDLSRSELSSSNLSKTEFNGSRLDNTVFIDITAEYAKFDRLLSADRTAFTNVDLLGASFEESDLSTCTFNDVKNLNEKYVAGRIGTDGENDINIVR